MAWQEIEAANKRSNPAAPYFFSSKKWIKLIPKTIGNRKRDCAWGCARDINTTWENLQIKNYKSGRRSFRSPDWFVLLICRFSQVVFISPSATSRTISFSISNSFWYKFRSVGPARNRGAINGSVNSWCSRFCPFESNGRELECEFL